MTANLTVFVFPLGKLWDRDGKWCA